MEKLDIGSNLKIGDQFIKIGNNKQVLTIKKIEGDKVFVESDIMPGKLWQWPKEIFDADVRSGNLKFQPVQENNNKNKTMNINEVRSIIRQTIAEAMEEKGKLPSSGGKLVHLKKELQSLKGMREALGQYQIAEGGEDTPGFVAEYAHMQKFVNELEKIKAAHSKLAEMLDNQISQVEGKVSSETEKIKEMMGLIEKAKKPAAKKDDKKAPAKKDDKKDDKKEEPKEEKPAAKKAEKKDK
jgi:flagellar biosynthesis chaperone FliJ